MRAFIVSMLLIVPPQISGFVAGSLFAQVYEAEQHDQLGISQRIADPAASEGVAVRCSPEMHPPRQYIFATGYYETSPGRYRATWRLKTSMVGADKPLIDVDCTQPGQEPYRMAAAVFKGADFKKADEWQEFQMKFDRLELGRAQYRALYLGNGDIAMDCLKIEKLSDFTEEELYQRMTSNTLYAVTLPGDLAQLWQKQRDSTFHVLELKNAGGLGFESSWSVPAAVRCLPRYELTSHSWTQVWHHAFNRGAYFPDSYETLFKYDAVIMTCGDVGRLLAIGRDMLRRYVQEGGGLVMLGGYYSYGKGHVRNTRFGELLPVQADSQWDLAQTPDTDIDNARLWFGLFPFPKGWKPSAYWIHRVKVRPEARVVWTCGGQPAVCVWNCGKGRVVTITLTPLGAPPAGASLFCQTPEWPSVLAQMLQWAGENGMAK